MYPQSFTSLLFFSDQKSQIYCTTSVYRGQTKQCVFDNLHGTSTLHMYLYIYIYIYLYIYLLLNLISPRDYVGSSVPPFVRSHLWYMC